MLKSLSARNFKSWVGLQGLKLGNVNLLFGENSSGKTSIAQMILLLKQTVESFDRSQPLNLEGIVDLGSYEDIISGHNLDTNLFLSYAWDDRGQETSLQVEFQYISNSIRVKHMKLMHDGESAELRVSDDDQYQFYRNGVLDEEMGPHKRTRPVKYYGFPSMITRKYPHLNDWSLMIEDWADTVYYLGPLRHFPQRTYKWYGSPPEDVGFYGENTVQVMLANLFDREQATDVERTDMVDLVGSCEYWLKRMGLAETFEVKKLPGRMFYEVVLRVPQFETHANLADVGVGVSQVLPVIILAHQVPEGSTIILEQPELHLHPSVQASLAELFFEVGLQRNIQFLVETHSEHLLTRLQRKVAESESEVLEGQNIQLYFCKRESGQSVLEELEMDETGRIQNWPPHFFGDAISDREAIMKAFLKKKKRGDM